jgi:hypothetical protein
MVLVNAYFHLKVRAVYFERGILRGMEDGDSLFLL